MNATPSAIEKMDEIRLQGNFTGSKNQVIEFENQNKLPTVALQFIQR